MFQFSVTYIHIWYSRYVSLPEGDAILRDFPLLPDAFIYDDDLYLDQIDALTAIKIANRLERASNSSSSSSPPDAQPLRESSNSSGDANGDGCVPLPASFNGKGEVNFIEVATEAGIPGLGKLLGAILDPMFSPIVSDIIISSVHVYYLALHTNSCMIVLFFLNRQV